MPRLICRSMDTKFLREVKDYEALVRSLPASFTGDGEDADPSLITTDDITDQDGKLVSLTASVCAMEFSVAVQVRKHFQRPIRQCWPVHMTLLHHKHPLLCPVVDHQCLVPSMMSAYWPLRKKLDKVAAKFGIESQDVRHCLSKRVAKMLERVFESSLMIRYAAKCAEDVASPWDVVMSALKCHADDVLIERVLRRVSELIVVMPPDQMFRSKWAKLGRKPPLSPIKRTKRRRPRTLGPTDTDPLRQPDESIQNPIDPVEGLFLNLPDIPPQDHVDLEIEEPLDLLPQSLND